jgi:hypothetical protein
MKKSLIAISIGLALAALTFSTILKHAASAGAKVNLLRAQNDGIQPQAAAARSSRSANAAGSTSPGTGRANRGRTAPRIPNPCSTRD